MVLNDDDESVANAGRWDTLKPVLSAPIRHALLTLNFDQMTPVQASTVPLFMSHKDVIVEAVTGSGKTLAFVIPIMEMVLRRIHDRITNVDDNDMKNPLKQNEVMAVVISPTRELAKQIFDVVTVFVDAVNTVGLDGNGRNVGHDDTDEQSKMLTHMLFIGGNDTREDVQRFKNHGAHIIVGTPGRLDDLFKRQQLFDFRALEVLVMDEADRLLDMGFEQTLTSILRKLPKQRRTGLFSATMNEAVDALVKAGLRNPVRVTVRVESLSTGLDSTDNADTADSDQRTPTSLDIGYTLAQPDERLVLLVRLLSTSSALNTKFMVYFSTCACVDYFYKVLPQLDMCKSIQFHSLHGKMDPKRREAVYTRFSHAPTGSVLLCTDIAARGLDIPDVDWVIQFDPPQDPKAFAHRCGRTARLGRHGRALVFLAPQEDTYIEFLRLRKVPIKEVEVTDLLVGTKSTEMLTTLSLLETLRSLSLSDRDVYEKSIKAFVSWVRAYSEHQASYIFRLKQVDLASAARSFGILRLPRMPELKNIKVTYDTVDFDPQAIRYRDKQREKQRKVNMAKKAAEMENDEHGCKSMKQSTNHDDGSDKKKTQAWSHKKEVRERRLERKDKRERRRVAKLMSNGKDASGQSRSTKPDDQSKDGQTKRKIDVEMDSDSGGNDDFLDDYSELRKERRRKRGKSGGSGFLTTE